MDAIHARQARLSWGWPLLVVAALLATLLAYRFYPLAFPLIDVPITMDRAQALQEAQRFSEEAHCAPSLDPQQTHAAASFEVDFATQTFVELSVGRQAFAEMARQNLYQPYTWRIRRFQENRIAGVWVWFTPQGKFYGFSETIAETTPGAALVTNDARAIAESQASAYGVQLDQWQAVEKTREFRSSGRIDHQFTYERTQRDIGEGRYRLTLGVSGDHLSSLRYHILIPEAFTRHYAELRSANSTISALATAGIGLFYILGGCMAGLFILAKRRRVLWRGPLILASIIAGLQFADQLNHLPLAWMHYDTAFSRGDFLIETLFNASSSALLDFVLLFFSFAAAESLGRQAFGHHPQFWRAGIKTNFLQPQILGQLSLGYLLVPLFFLYEVLVYWIGAERFHWWTPSDMLFQPNALASYLPWLSSVAASLHAGFWEECLFRALPLAGGAWLGGYWNRRRLGIGLAFILQALIFSAAHASYPAQPAYVRVVELLFPSVIFGAIYLRYGLIPGIILHYTFDVVSFAVPIFAAQVGGIWKDQIAIVGLSVIPLVVYGIRAWRTHRRALGAIQLNADWQPPIQGEFKAPPVAIDPRPTRLGTIPARVWGVLSAVIIGLTLVVCQVWPPHPVWPPLDLDRQQARQLIQAALKNPQNHLSAFSESPWRLTLNPAASFTEDHAFVWRTADSETYQRLLGGALRAPRWSARIVRFDVPVSERAEELHLSVRDAQQPVQWRHLIPEGRVGATLESPAALALAREELRKWGLTEHKILTANSYQRPTRRDWVFVFEDLRFTLPVGNVRFGVSIAGDEAVERSPFVYIPEEWARQERNRSFVVRIIHASGQIAGYLLCFVLLLVAANAWIRNRIRFRSVLHNWVIFWLLSLGSTVNAYLEFQGQLSTLEAPLTQHLKWLAAQMGSALALSLFVALGCSTLRACLQEENQRSGLKPPALPHLILSGLALGGAFGIIGLLYSTFYPNPELPTLRDYSGLALWQPYLQPHLVFNLVWGALYVTLGIASFYYLQTRTLRKHGWGYLWLIILSLILSAPQSHDLNRWFIESALFVAQLCGLIWAVRLRELSTVVIAMIVSSLVIGLPRLWVHAYPGSEWVALCSLMTEALAGCLLFAYLRPRPA